MNAKPRLLLATGFFAIWVSILYAGAYGLAIVGIFL
jgi:hypothetical protein